MQTALAVAALLLIAGPAVGCLSAGAPSSKVGGDQNALSASEPEGDPEPALPGGLKAAIRRRARAQTNLRTTTNGSQRLVREAPTPGGGEVEFIQVDGNIKSHLRQERWNNQARLSAAAGAHFAQRLAAGSTSANSQTRPSSGPRMQLLAQHPEQDATARTGGGAISRSEQIAGPPALVPPPNPQLDQLNRLYLDSAMPVEVEAHLGETAYLLCSLRTNLQHANQLQVSWVRNVQILTSGESRYTSDERFRASHQAGSPDWLLEIHSVRADDAGDYECQVNSEPRPASVRVRLAVIAAHVEIVEAPEVRVDEDEQIKLTCRVQFNSSESRNALAERAAARGRHPRRRHASASRSAASNWQPYIYWYKGNVSLDYNNARGNVQVHRRGLTSGGFESVLRLGRASRADNGTYTCKLVPELNEVRPAEARVLVAASAASSRRQARLPNWLALTASALLAAASLSVQTIRPPRSLV